MLTSRPDQQQTRPLPVDLPERPVVEPYDVELCSALVFSAGIQIYDDDSRIQFRDIIIICGSFI